MTAVAIRYSPVTALSLPRIGAWSASFTIHIVALALLLSAPVAYKLVNRETPDQTVVIRMIDEKPIPIVKELEPPPPIVRHEHKAERPAPPVAPSVTADPTPMSTASTETVAPPAIDTGPAQQTQPDTEPSAIAYGTHTTVPYPHESLKAREQGTVMLLVLVGVDGKVEDIRIDKSSGFTRLDRAARDAVKLWNFNPAHHGGVAQRAWAKVPISFTLSTL
jgi:protein TonB